MSEEMKPVTQSPFVAIAAALEETSANLVAAAHNSAVDPLLLRAAQSLYNAACGLAQLAVEAHAYAHQDRALLARPDLQLSLDQVAHGLGTVVRAAGPANAAGPAAHIEDDAP